MNYNKAIITFIASASAIKIQSQAQSEDFWSDLADGFENAWDDVQDWGENAWEDVQDWGEDVIEKTWDVTTKVIGFGLDVTENLVDSWLAFGDYIISDDGLIEDLEYVFSADFGKDLLEVGDAIITGELFIDGYNWMADGDNWAALLNVGLSTGKSLVTGELEEAWNTATNWELYDGDHWDPETRYKEAYEEYKKQYNEQNIQLVDLKVKKASKCSKMEYSVGEKAYRLYDAVDVNYTVHLSAQIGGSTMSKFYQYFHGSPNREQCEQADCLHPCYGAAHESNCNLCFQDAFVADVKAKFTPEQFQQICGACSVPAKEIELPPMKTYEEFKAHLEAQQKKQ